MEWYEVSQFADKVEDLEKYFISLAANEEDISLFGFRHALQLPGAEDALAALLTFAENFAAFRQEAERLGRTFTRELEQLDGQDKLTEQVALISLRLRMAQAKTPERINVFSAVSRVIGLGAKSKSLFGETQVSLHVAIINLEKLRALAKRGSKLLQEKAASDDEVFKPSNVRSDRVVELIDAALAQISSLTSLEPRETARLELYLTEARAEAQSDKPSWSKIIGALVIVAAVTSGLADAPGAAKTVRDAIEYILGTSVAKPLQRYLPAPPVEKFDTPPAPQFAAS